MAAPGIAVPGAVSRSGGYDKSGPGAARRGRSGKAWFGWARRGGIGPIWTVVGGTEVTRSGQARRYCTGLERRDTNWLVLVGR